MEFLNNSKIVLPKEFNPVVTIGGKTSGSQEFDDQNCNTLQKSRLIPLHSTFIRGADASFNLYEDEGTNYNYEKGSSAVIPIKYTEATKTITVDDRKGSFNGMLSKRIFRINIITPKHAKTLDFNAKCDKEIFYERKKISNKDLVKLNI